MSATRISLSDQQRRVVAGQGNQVVVAGAGTGKTETLTHRILHLLDGENACRLHEIVALTFTDKAAGEMRRRVYQSILQRLIHEDDPQKRQVLEALRAGFAEQNRIGTFDAFNHRLLSLHPEYDLLPPAFSPMTPHDVRELRQLLVRAFWNYAETLLGNDREDLFYLLDRYERPSLLALIEGLAKEDCETLENLACEVDESTFLQQLRATVAAFAARFESREMRQTNALWQRYLQALPDTIPPSLLAQLQIPEEVRISKECALLTQKHTWKVNWRKAFLKNEPQLEALLDELESEVLPILGRWRDAEKALAHKLEIMRNAQSSVEADWQAQEVLRRLARLALWWQQKRQELCFRRGWAEFDDVYRAAWQLLQEQQEVRDKLRSGSRYILVDEFQDTNRGQWKFVNAFRRKDNVLLVGDGKQAIYGFRGGDIAVFETVRERELQDCEVHELSISRRSTPAIVDFCNRVFAAVLPAPTGEDEFIKEEYEAEFQHLECGRSDGLPGSVRLLHADAAERQSNDGEDDEIQLIADATARFLRDLQDDADTFLKGEEGAALRQPEYSGISERIARDEPATIGILFRTHQRKAFFEAALRRYKVRFASVKGIGFYQTQAVGDAWNLLRFCADEADEIALAGVLRSPLIGLSDLALLEIRTHAVEKNLWSFLEARGDEVSFLSREQDRRALQIGLPRLRDWKSASRVRRMSEVLESVLRENEIVFHDALHSDAEQRAENWRKVLDAVREREALGQGSPRALAAYFEAQLEAEERESEAALPEGGAVQLMTIFAAKGLGFPMTIVAELDGKPRRETSSIKRGELPVPGATGKSAKYFSLKVKLLDSDEDDNQEQKTIDPVLWTILSEEERARQNAEFRRLLYVACTRAADHLLLAWPDEAPDESWATMLAPFVSELESVAFSARQEEISHQADESRLELSISMPDWKRGVLPRATSVTQLLRFFSVESHSHFSGNKVRRDMGTALHRLIKSGASPELTRCSSVGLAMGLSQGCARDLFTNWQSAHDWLQSNNCDLKTARREISFSLPTSVVRGVLGGEREIALENVETVNGQIDLLVSRRDENGASVWAVVDFKTTSDLSEFETTAKCRNYDLQLRIYLAAARHLGVEAEEAWLIALHESGETRALCYRPEYSEA